MILCTDPLIGPKKKVIIRYLDIYMRIYKLTKNVAYPLKDLLTFVCVKKKTNAQTTYLRAVTTFTYQSDVKKYRCHANCIDVFQNFEVCR